MQLTDTEVEAVIPKIGKLCGDISVVSTASETTAAIRDAYSAGDAGLQVRRRDP